ncbi:MAG: hypothetical protein GY868_11460, partial [Deltaproteobacteria bacterium]|nr:hypothetical protein [Deltaproteobacteria bacterium]
MAYTIIFTGKTAQGRREPAVRAELATLFRVDSGRVSRLFSREGAVVKSGLDYAAAQKYVAAIGRAGAICRIEDESAPRPSGTVDVGAVPAQTREGTLPTTDGVEIGLADSAYAPRVCHLVNGSSRGLNLNRNDVQELAFTRIHLAAVVKEVRPMEERCLVVFFCSGERRPYVIDADKIAYADFPGVKGTNLVESLRNLIIYAYEQNPAMRFDDATGKFLAGQKLPLFEKDINRLITALGKSLEAGRWLPAAPVIARQSTPAAVIQHKVAAAEPGGEPVTAAAVPARTEPEVLTRCPKCSRPLISDEPECAGCGLLFAKWTKRQQKLDETARQMKPDEVSEVPPLETVDAWTERGGRI